MANIRILELAKELSAEVADVQRMAVRCGIVASGPTSMLNSEDKEKVISAIKAERSAPKALKPSGKTLTLNRPIVAGQQGQAMGSVEGRGRTVRVEVRRRHQHAPGQGAVATAKGQSPAERAKQAVDLQAVEKAARKAAERAEVKAKVDRPVAQRPAPMERPRPARPEAGRGPRTTIRKGPTPAQIAAAKAPSSTVKEVEARIRAERSAARAARPQQQYPRPAGGANKPAGAGSPRRSPSVAVAPSSPPPGQRRRFGQARPQRLMSPAERAARRDYEEKRHAAPLTEEQEERMARLAGKGRKRRLDEVDGVPMVVRDVDIPDTIIVSELASRMAVKGAEVVKKLFQMGMQVTVNETIDADTAQLIVEEFGHRFKRLDATSVEDVLVDVEDEEDKVNLQPRPPVVVVMGHVDHGKTSILDNIRNSTVTEGEAGGITQHIGAYMIKLEDASRVVFLDTPGHEAFTSLRARGAEITDVAVLVVAADDGVKPQTVEALNPARAAKVPIIVAVNKMDRPEADPEKIKRQLSEHELLAEDWGGDVPFVPVSAKTGEGLSDLLEMLALQSELLELKANPEKRGRGVVIEARLDKGRGPVATVLVQSGTFKQGDIAVVGTVMGRIRAIVDENSVQHRTAGPSIPFELLGLEEVPEAGMQIVVVDTDRQAREIISFRKDKIRQSGIAESAKSQMNLDELFAAVTEGGVKELNVGVKADVSGSVEAMVESLRKCGTDEVQVKVVHKGIGGITETDVMLASAANAIILGFNVRPESKARKVAEAEGVDVRFYRVIYDAIDDITLAMQGMLEPKMVEKVIGTADVREVFSVPKLGAVAGCFITDGFVTRHAEIRVLRDSVLVYEGNLASLRRFKDDVKEVKNGYECGIGVEKFNDIKVGDTFEFFLIEEVS
ncbi:MAG: translation initiation factor IF-2 [Mariprofundaceae bacterium]